MGARRVVGLSILNFEINLKILPNYFQLHATFETLDAMGANFINSCLEQFARTFKEGAQKFREFQQENCSIDIIMSILSNYVPHCL